MIHQWKKALLEGASEIFERGGKKQAAVDEETVRSLRAKIGEPAVANDFCHESSSPGPGREAWDDRIPPPSTLSIGAQCRLLSISRSSFYDAPQGETAVNPPLMRLITDSSWKPRSMASSG